MHQRFVIKISLIIVVIVLIIIGFGVIYNVNLVTYNSILSTKMYRVYDTGYYYTIKEYKDNKGINHEKRLVYCESYVVVNAPEDVTNLKEEIKYFEQINPLNFEHYQKCDAYERQYIKESKEMTRRWKPTFMDESEENHYSNIIATTTRIKDEGRIIYNLRPLDSKFKEIERKKFEEYYE